MLESSRFDEKKNTKHMETRGKWKGKKVNANASAKIFFQENQTNERVLS
jgi:hypothetical protein